MAFGTHRPGEHSIYAPAPKQIEIARVLPPVSEEDVRRFRQKRRTGSAAPGGGDAPVTYPLLTDLVAGWALTAGPQQTLDSSGVIASGPLDYATQYGSPDYNSAGMGKTLAPWGLAINQPVNPIFPAFGIDPFFLFFQASKEAGIGTCRWASDDDNTVVSVTVNFDAGTIVLSLYDGVSYTNLSSTTFDNANTRHTIFAWWQPGTMNLKVDGGATDSQSGPNLLYTEDPAQLGYAVNAFISTGAPERLRYARLWMGDISNAVVAVDWLYNAGAGRTDAEVAAYTG